MIELTIHGQINASVVIAAPVEEVEEMLHEEIGTSLTKEIIKHIDDMSFIEMEMNEEHGMFEYTAELVLCSKNDIITNAQMQAQKLSAYGLNEEQIVDVLDTVTQETSGF